MKNQSGWWWMTLQESTQNCVSSCYHQTANCVQTCSLSRIRTLMRPRGINWLSKNSKEKIRRTGTHTRSSEQPNSECFLKNSEYAKLYSFEHINFQVWAKTNGSSWNWRDLNLRNWQRVRRATDLEKTVNSNNIELISPFKLARRHYFMLYVYT